MRDYYKGDPYWIELRYPGTCAGCGAKLPKGARAFYYPRGKKLFGSADACCGSGDANSESFNEMARAEYAYSRGW